MTVNLNTMKKSRKNAWQRALKAEKYFDTNNAEVYTMDINPYAYQQEILDKLEAERAVRGYMRNLIVAATGTGKTVISALDYKRFRRHNPGRPCRLLFVAHREEILKQSMYTFRAVLKDANFGEMFVGAVNLKASIICLSQFRRSIRRASRKKHRLSSTITSSWTNFIMRQLRPIGGC